MTPVANAKILYLEDEPTIGQLYGQVLAQAGYQVTLEPDGQKGLKLAQTDQFDIILLDLMLPNLAGRDILQILRDKSKTPNLKAKIVILTNLEQDNQARAALAKQADGYLIKADFTPHDLVNFLGDLKL
ncbi:MAG: response regulator transcription factor [Candidatus Saccharimonadales bacterium]